AQDNGRRQREIEGEGPAPDVEVAGQPSERHAEHDQETETRNAEPHEYQHLAQRKNPSYLCVLRVPGVDSTLKRAQPPERSTRFHSGRCRARRSRAWRCARSTPRILCAACRRRPSPDPSPPSAFATS